jgi:hypothetical protein
MYIKIDTEDCTAKLSTFLLDVETNENFPHYSPEALISAIKIVMRNNHMKFGDIFVRQLVGIAMGMSPTPSVTNLYVAVYEEQELLKFLGTSVFYLRRFIDDDLAIWLHHPNPHIDKSNWIQLKRAVTSGCLGWTFTTRSSEVVFMDMTIKIEGPHIETNLFEKPLSLYLYIPPHSYHAPGVSASTVMGKVLRIHQLYTHPTDISQHLRKFYGRLLERGYQQDTLIPLFQKAITATEEYLQTSDDYRQIIKIQQQEANKRRVFFHLPFHPDNPTSKELQQLWRHHIFSPDGKQQLNHLHNKDGAPIPVD